MVRENEIIQAVKRIRDTAMEQTLAARIPECGEFGAIAQDADWLFDTLTAAARVRAEANNECGEAARPAPQQSGWKPIETAPKDGTDILGWHEIAGTSQTCFSEGEWVCPDWDEDRYIHCTWSPTHWMPLPTPPTAGGGDA